MNQKAQKKVFYDKTYKTTKELFDNSIQYLKLINSDHNIFKLFDNQKLNI